MICWALAVPARALVFSSSNTTQNGSLAGSMINGNTMTLVTEVTNEHSSIWYNSQVSLTSFRMSFTYQFGGGIGDGWTFSLQNSGVNTLSTNDGGSGLGVYGLTNIFSSEFDTVNQPGGIAFQTDGAVGSYVTPGSVNLTSGNPITVMITYDGTTLTQVLTNTVTLATYTSSTTVNLTTLIGSSVGYIGFTGASGAGDSYQYVSNATYGALALPEPSALSLFLAAFLGMLLLPRRRLA